MDNFDLRKYLTEGRLLKEGIPQGSEIADYVEGMFNSDVVEKEGFQSDIWRKEQYASNDYREGSVFLDLVDHLKSVGGKDVLEGNPDIHLELLSNDDIQWSADVTLDENLAEGRLFEQEYPELISFLNANVEDVKQHMRDEFLDDEDEVEYNATISKEIDQVKSFQDVGKTDDIVGAVVRQGEGDVGITYMFKDDYDALEDKSKFENDYGYPPEDIKIAGKDLKFFTFTI